MTISDFAEAGDDEADIRSERSWTWAGGRRTIMVDLTLTMTVLLVTCWAAINHTPAADLPSITASFQDERAEDPVFRIDRQIASTADAAANAARRPLDGSAPTDSARRATIGLDDSLGRSGKLSKLIGRTNGPELQIASAIRATAAQSSFDAIAAEGALERADHRLPRSGGQIPVATFAVRSQIEHAWLLRVVFSNGER